MEGNIIIRDTTTLGGLAGIIGTIPEIIFNFIFIQLGIAKYYTFQLSAGVHLLTKFTNQPLGLIYGGVIWLFTASFLGILIAYFLKFTGKDYWWFKGIIISIIIMHIGIYGVGYNMGGAQLVPRDITTNMLILVANIIFGLTTSYLIIKLSGELLEK